MKKRRKGGERRDGIPVRQTEKTAKPTFVKQPPCARCCTWHLYLRSLSIQKAVLLGGCWLQVKGNPTLLSEKELKPA